MKYMVMECHLSYAVVLDEEGRFLKVANMHYEVGQTVTEVIEMQISQPVPEKKKANKWMYSLAAMAACLVLAVTSVFQIRQMPYASVYLRINPEVRIDVNRNDVVVDLEGVNADGDDLIRSYNYKKKDLDLVMDELVDKAIEMGYLHEGGRITLSLDADEEWIVTHGEHLNTHLNEHLTDKIAVTIDVEQKQAGESSPVPIGPIVIPVGADSYEESDYSDSDGSGGDSDTDDGSSYHSSESSEDDDAPFEDDSSDDSGQSVDDAEDNGQTGHVLSDNGYVEDDNSGEDDDQADYEPSDSEDFDDKISDNDNSDDDGSDDDGSDDDGSDDDGSDDDGSDDDDD